MRATSSYLSTESALHWGKGATHSTWLTTHDNVTISGPYDLTERRCIYRAREPPNGI